MYVCSRANIPIKKFCAFAVLIISFFSIIWISISIYEKLTEYASNRLCDKSVEYISEHNDLYNFPITTLPKPWYLANGTHYPKPATISKKTGRRDAKLLPYEDPESDRIINQLMFVPPNYDFTRRKETMKRIYVHRYPLWWNITNGDSIFVNSKCPVDACTITEDPKERQNANLVIFNQYYDHTNDTRPPNQLYAMYYTEPPWNTKSIIRFSNHSDVINWTISYRHDSTIVAPYNIWVYYDPRIKQREQYRNYAANKTKKVAWMVSNCIKVNGRLEYAKELQKYIQVDIYGKCGTLECSCKNIKNCTRMIEKDYKFYLAFENSNCKDYITEKLFDTGLRHNAIPIVMGAPRHTYEKVAPLRSYIHVEDFESPKQLAKYLHILDENDNLYNSFFKWKGAGEFVGKGDAGTATLPWLGPYFWCRICAMLHDEYSTTTPNWYHDINEWQHKSGICTNGGFWRDLEKVVND